MFDGPLPESLTCTVVTGTTCSQVFRDDVSPDVVIVLVLVELAGDDSDDECQHETALLVY